MQPIDSQLVPAVLLVMTGPILIFLLWVFCSLHREIEHAKRTRTPRRTRIRARLARLS